MEEHSNLILVGRDNFDKHYDTQVKNEINNTQKSGIQFTYLFIFCVSIPHPLKSKSRLYNH
jgi:hypothetical protein